jgi:hypothetical protein
MAVTPNFSWPTPDDGDLVSAGAQAIRVLGDAVDAAVFANQEAISDVADSGFRFAGTVYFTSSGSFLKADPLGTGDIGLRAIRVRCVGGGGAGGGAAATDATQNSLGNGGGGGGYAESFITDIAGLSASVTITRGSGGSGVSGAAGNNGQDSSFGALVVGEGGNGASLTTATTVRRGVGTANGGRGTGDLVIEGQPGGMAFNLVAGTSSVTQIVSGAGGTSGIGSGGGNQTAGAGAPGKTAGGGGSGAANQISQSAVAGGSGINGIVIVDCYV